MDDSDTAYVMVYQERVLVRVLGRIVTRDDGIQGNMCDKDKFGSAYIWRSDLVISDWLSISCNIYIYNYNWNALNDRN